MNNNQGNNKTNRTSGAYWASLGPRPFLSLMVNVRGLLGFIGLIAMALMSCSSSEDGSEPIVPPQETGTPIAFSANQGEESAVTRGNRRAGTPLSETGVHAFNVWGYKSMTYSNGEYSNNQTVFPGYIVNWAANSAASTSSNSSGWEYVAQQTSGDEQTIKYWDWSAKAYRFYAVTAGEPNVETPGQVSFTMTANASPVREGDGTEAEKIAANIADTPYFSKLWFSTGDPVAYPDKQFGKPVQLEFIKPFARVRFLFNYSYEAEGIKLKDPSFKPKDGSEIKLKGTFTVTYPLEGTATSESYTLTPESNPEAGETLDAFTEAYIPEGTEKWYTVLPNNTQGSYTLSVSVNGKVKPCVVPAQYMQWKPGFSYTYIFKITDNGGVEIDMVQAAFTPWIDNVSDEYEVYNW